MKLAGITEKLNTSVNEEHNKLKSENIIKRIWDKDYSVWSDSPDEVSNRLGWLKSIEASFDSLKEINSFVESVKKDGFKKVILMGGFKKVILMGMGGSSLAPEVFRQTFGVKKGYLDLIVVDSTHPDYISEVENEIIYDETLFLVSTKSGSTVETVSFMKYFFNKSIDKIGKENTGKHFVAITDPGSGLEKTAKQLNFRKIFLNDPNIGGRYSALSLFGMVPAALVGLDLEKILSRAKIMANKCSESNDNPGVELGVILGVSALAGLDKVTLITSPKLSFFGAWLEQLIAESTGKDGKGIVPVDLEEILSVNHYSRDRIFIYIKLKHDNCYNVEINELEKSGFPVISIELEDIYDLGKEFFRWEFATIVAGIILGIQPFDQPNVESAKVVAREMMDEFKNNGVLPSLTPNINENEIKIYGDINSNNLKDAPHEFFRHIVKDKSYVAIQAYIKPDKKFYKLLHKIRTIIQKKYKVATTFGYGPRFLHSTGQLHKGDGGNGLFIQILSEPENDLLIPDNPGENSSTVSFGVLIKAQALGDRKAMLANKRKVLTVDLGKNTMDGLQKLISIIND
jgi:glucose-6-phosphate isomerase